jgi:hypothetical protein
MVPLLFLALQFSRAQAPTGTFDYGFDSNTGLWDLTGDYFTELSVQQNNGQFTEIALGYTIVQDAQGKLSGTGTTGILIGAESVAGNYIVSGQVRSKGGIRQVTLIIRITGDAFVGGKLIHYGFTISLTNGEIDPDNGTIIGDCKVSGKFAGGSLSGIASFETALPGNMTGDWTLTLTITPFGDLVGTGLITLSNGRTATFSLLGTFEFASDIRLTGTGDNKRGAMRVALFDDTSLAFAKGIVFGQKIEISPAPPDEK